MVIFDTGAGFSEFSSNSQKVSENNPQQNSDTTKQVTRASYEPLSFWERHPPYQQPPQHLHSQHFKPNNSATPSNTKFCTAFSPQDSVSPALFQRGMSADSPGMFEYKGTPHGIPHLPNIASSVNHSNYLQSEVLPSISPQPMQLLSKGVANPFVVAINQFNTSSSYRDPISSGAGLSEQPRERFLEAQNFPFSFQPQTNSYSSNSYQNDARLTFFQQEFLAQPPSMTQMNAFQPLINSSTINAMDSFYENKRFICEMCHKEFPSQYRLKSHSLVHTAIKAYRCDLCGKNFGRSHDMKRHMRSHASVQKNLICQDCGKSFSRSDALRRHMRLICKCLPPQMTL